MKIKSKKKLVKALDKIQASVERLKNCGAGAPGSPGFQQNNTCAGGGGGSDALSMDGLFSEDELRGAAKKNQPVSTQADLYNLAKENKDEFDLGLNHGKGVDKALGGKAIYPTSVDEFVKALEEPGPSVIIAGLKGEKRAKEKVEGKYGGDWSRLTDVVRATIAVEKKEDIPKAVKAAREHLGKQGFTLLEVDDRISNPTPGGYRDLQTLWKSKDGFVTELQFNTKKMIHAKETVGHKLYEEYRSIEESGGGDAARLRSLATEMKSIYQKAW